MIAVDTNVLVCAFREDMPQHATCLKELEEISEQKWAICWPSVHEFLATVTRRRYFNPPSSMARAMAGVSSWMTSANLRLLSEGPGYFEILQGLLEQGEIVGAAVHDARIAAICLSHGVEELVSMDRDFKRFPQLRTREPGD